MITFKSGYKYQLAGSATFSIPLYPPALIEADYVTLTPTGILTIGAGYAWDGPSGPTIDTADFMQGSLVHDVLYQLMRDEKLPREHRDQADRILQKYCIDDGMCRIRAWWVYLGVKYFGGKNVRASRKKRIRYAP